MMMALNHLNKISFAFNKISSIKNRFPLFANFHRINSCFDGKDIQIRCNQSSNENILHTIRVKHDIENKRKTSLLGGGLERIESQHQKVLK